MSKKSQNSEIPLDRSFFNTSYMMLLLNNRLATWAKEHKLNTTKTYLMFVTQVESLNLSDVFLSLVYFDGEKEHVIPAGYIGHNLTEKEKLFCKNLPIYTTQDFVRQPPYEIMMTSRLKDIKDESGIVHEVSLAIHNFMTETAMVGERIPAQLANGNGNSYLFVRDIEGVITKMEFYLKDMSNFIKKIDQQRHDDIRQSVKGILKQEKTA